MVTVNVKQLFFDQEPTRSGAHLFLRRCRLSRRPAPRLLQDGRGPRRAGEWARCTSRVLSIRLLVNCTEKGAAGHHRIHTPQDLYALLECDPGVHKAALKKAYRKRALLDHPDKNPDDPSAGELYSKALTTAPTGDILCRTRKLFPHNLQM